MIYQSVLTSVCILAVCANFDHYQNYQNPYGYQPHENQGLRRNLMSSQNHDMESSNQIQYGDSARNMGFEEVRPHHEYQRENYQMYQNYGAGRDLLQLRRNCKGRNCNQKKEPNFYNKYVDNDKLLQEQGERNKVEQIVRGAGQSFKFENVKKRGLVIIDVQNDFIGNFSAGVGSLSVFEDPARRHGGPNAFLDRVTGNDFARRVGTFIDTAAAMTTDKNNLFYDFIIYTFDFHPQNHCSFWQPRYNNEIDTQRVTRIDPFDRDICVFNPHAHDNLPPFEATNFKTCEFKNGGQFFWPKHCRQGTLGAQLHDYIPRLQSKNPEKNEFTIVSPNANLGINSTVRSDMTRVWDTIGDGKRMTKEVKQRVYIVYKGMKSNVDSYSAFYGFADPILTMRNGQQKLFSTGLHEQLQTSELKNLRTNQIQLDMLGIAYDVCVANSAVDAADLGYKVNILDYVTASVLPEDHLQFISEKKRLHEAKVHRIDQNGQMINWGVPKPHAGGMQV